MVSLHETLGCPLGPKDLSQAQLTFCLQGAQSWGSAVRWTMTYNTPTNCTMWSSGERNPSWALQEINLKVLKMQPRLPWMSYSYIMYFTRNIPFGAAILNLFHICNSPAGKKKKISFLITRLCFQWHCHFPSIHNLKSLFISSLLPVPKPKEVFNSLGLLCALAELYNFCCCFFFLF